MKCLLFSAVFGLNGKYEKIHKPDNWDLIVFTDNSSVLEADACWTICTVKKPYKDNRLCNRYYKWKIHEILPKYDVYFYTDSKWILHKNIIEYVHTNLDLSINHFFEHFQRKCTYKEAGFVKKKNKNPIEQN